MSAELLERGILKGRIAGLVATRNMFTGMVNVAEGEEDSDVWDQYITAVMTDMYSILSTLWVAETIQVQHKVGNGWDDVSETAFVGAGVVSGDALPNAVAAVLIAKVAGGHHVGRKFFGNVAEASTLGNELTTGSIAAATGTLIAYVSPFTSTGGSTLTPGILDRNNVFRPFIGGFVSSLLGSMRRRKPGLGI